MLYTRAGDKGTTKTFGCDQRMSKSSAIAEALGSLDEVNSFLGLCKVKGKESRIKIQESRIEEIVHNVQQNLFIVQAELAGAPKSISKEKVLEAEKLVDGIEKELPPIKTFFISGGTPGKTPSGSRGAAELSALFDVARTLARRAERRVVAVHEEGRIEISADTFAYLNRLSSLLYVLARLSNHKSGIVEQSPSYK